jgi:cysteine desulfurase
MTTGFRRRGAPPYNGSVSRRTVPTRIYLDHAATTPLCAEARAAMEPYLTENFANASSVYRPAQAARSAIDGPRDSVAAILGARPADVIFTSGGTESDNAAIKGVAFAGRDRGRHLVTTAIEHHAVLHPVEELTERFGFESTVVPVRPNGMVDPLEIERALRTDTVLISVMWANNEIGTIQPIAEIAEIARSRGVLLHVDAVQAAGAVSIDLSSVPVGLLSLSAHKFHGPKGVGVLVVRGGTTWWPLITGGTQERNRRAGTENVAGIVGLAAALEVADWRRDVAVERMRGLRDELLARLRARISDLVVNGDLERRLSGNLNVCIPGVHGESLLVALDLAGIDASSGSACASGSMEPSHVLTAIGVPHQLAQSSLRLTIGRETTQDEVERAAEVVTSVVARLRGLAPAARS